MRTLLRLLWSRFEWLHLARIAYCFEKSEPISTFTIEKSVDELVRCINPKLFTLQPSMQTVHDGDATIVLVTSFANPFVAVQVSPAETGSFVIYRQRFKSPEFNYPNFQEAVETCRYISSFPHRCPA